MLKLLLKLLFLHRARFLTGYSPTVPLRMFASDTMTVLVVISASFLRVMLERVVSFVRWQTMMFSSAVRHLGVALSRRPLIPTLLHLSSALPHLGVIRPSVPLPSRHISVTLPSSNRQFFLHIARWQFNPKFAVLTMPSIAVTPIWGGSYIRTVPRA